MLSTKRITFILLLFLTILTSFRLLWLLLSNIPDHPYAIQGKLDLQDWKHLSKHVINLDGEWEFYPDIQLIQPNFMRNETNAKRTVIDVPKTWSLPSTERTTDTYGIGSYHLQIAVNPDIGTHYGIHIPSIRSSSTLYVNGELLAQTGQPATERQYYQPMDAPRTIWFTSDADRLELVLVVANYDDPRYGGIVRSIKFGLAEPLQRHILFTTDIIRLACIIYFLYAIYSFILFWVGGRDKRLLYFSLMVLCIILGTLSGERILYEWLPISFDWTIKIPLLTTLAGGYCLLQCIRHLLSGAQRIKWIRIYGIACLIAALLTFILPTATLFLAIDLYLAVMLAPCLLVLLLLFRMTRRIDQDNLFLLLAAVAAINSLIWMVVIQLMKFEFISYPFDLIVALICLSIYWFKQFFRLLTESRHLSARLQEADKRKDEFLVTVAHEMRNPLHGIINLSQSLAERMDNRQEKENRRELDLLVTVSRRMSYLLNDLLDLARLKENRIVIKPDATDIRILVNSVMEMIRHLAEGKPISLSNRIPDSFPLVIADENRLIQILFNLLHNAVKFTSKGEICVEAKMQDGQARITVADTGTGIEASLLDGIFDPYAQASPATSDSGGFGLGLSICKQLVELHGGTLEVRSKVNEGSAFTFTLPIVTRLSPQQAVPEAVNGLNIVQAGTSEGDRVQFTPPRTGGTEVVRILAVDDDPVNLQVLNSIFSTAGYELYTTTSGKEALVMIDDAEWDLVIADRMMPTMSGYELISRIRERYSIAELPVLLLTAYNRIEDIEAGFQAGANDYVTKPVIATELRARALSLTNLKRSVTNLKRMEAAWLQAQIKPHFLINTFTAIAMLGRVDLNRMDRLVQELSQYVRLSIGFHNIEGMTSLEHEMQLVRSYLHIMQERYGQKLCIEWEIANCDNFAIPPLTIQPLVENALEHGIAVRSHGGRVGIRVEVLEQHYEISVTDNGKGMDTATLQTLLQHSDASKSGIALRNTDRRLKRYYGQGLNIHSTLGKGTTVSFAIPKLNR